MLREKQALIHKWTEAVHRMRQLVDKHQGTSFPDDAFREFCSVENECDSLVGRIVNLDGERFGPLIDPSWSRQERLESREQYHRDVVSRGVTPGAGLEDTPDPERRGNGGPTPFRSLGEMAQAVCRAMRPAGVIDPRLNELRAPTGQGELVGGDGGFLVQHDMTAEIWRRAYDEGQILRRCNRIPITTSANGICHNYLKETSRATGSRYGGLQVYRKAEAATVTATKAALAQFKLELETLMALVYVSDELIADAPQMDAFLRDVVPAALKFHVEDEILNGNGVGRCLGILNASCLVTVAKESAQTAATIKAENIEKMFARLPASSVGNAIWLVNQDTWPQIFQLNHKIANRANTDDVGGVPMFVPSGGLARAPFGTLLGVPIVPVEYCATLGTVGDIVLADFSQYALIEKGGIDVASSIHVQFLYGESVLRFTWRNNGAPGHSWAGGALTPFKGSNTQSPFIALATRS